jgi:DNA-binding MarR family transcriptional regulator
MDVTEERESYAPGPAPVSLVEISRVLEETARLLRDYVHTEPGPRRGVDRLRPVDAERVRAIIAARWLRREFLGFDAGEAEWGLMLELYAARLEGRRIHQTRLGVAAGLPQTTALRATRRLLADGICATEADPGDKRLLLITLSDPAAARIRAYLTTALTIAPPIA